jgi:hypothetical protein
VRPSIYVLWHICQCRIHRSTIVPTAPSLFTGEPAAIYFASCRGTSIYTLIFSPTVPGTYLLPNRPSSVTIVLMCWIVPLQKILLKRMNLINDYFIGALKQSSFVAGLSRNTLWRDFLESRMQKDRLKWETKLSDINDNNR